MHDPDAIDEQLPTPLFTLDVTRKYGWSRSTRYGAFHRRDTHALYEGRRVRRFSGFAAQAERRLDQLDAATCLADLAALRSNHLEALKGDRKGQHSVRINKQWRICFEWQGDGPHHVEIVDYH